MKRNPSPRPSAGKVLVVAAVLGAVVFGLFLGYLAWSNDSFPSTTRPFSNYADVVSATYNGTEYAFNIRWHSPYYVPTIAQLTSPASDTANTDVCDLKLNSVVGGQMIFMPFGLSGPSTQLTNVDLSVAVRSAVNGTQFTIVYHVDNVTATPGNIQPQNAACTQPSAPM